MFELAILTGALSTVAGMILLPQLKKIRGRAFHPRFSDDRIGIFVPCPGDRAESIKSCWRGRGREVNHEA
jgi:hypothetical protein